MKRLGTLVMAILVITGCNAMKPNMEEAELLWAETEKNIQKWAWDADDNASPTETLQTITEPMVEIPQKTPEPAEETTPQPVTAIQSPEPPLPEQESPSQPEQTADQQAENPKLIEWPYITCPPESPTATSWPYITAPEPPTYTPKPEPTELPQEQPTPTSQPVPDVPADPAPKPTEQPADPTPEQPTEQPSTGYAECSCGAKLIPEEVLPHMKAHAMKGESHSYRTY